MGTVLQDVISKTIDAEYIQRRVNDWNERVNQLFALINDWLPEGWEAKQGPSVVMHEDLMRKHDVGATQIPTLELSDRVGHVAKIVPRGLWIIGTNGRLDLKRQGHHYLIFDMAESFNVPDWQASSAKQRQILKAVNEDWLKRILQ